MTQNQAQPRRTPVLRSRVPASLSPFGFGPFEDFGRMVERFFGEGPLRAVGSWPGAREDVEFLPQIELVEQPGGLRLTAELPGVAQEDLDLRVEDGALVLAGEKKLEERSEEDGVVHTERRFGSFRRVLPLPFEVDVERSEATFENGVLTVQLPKAETAEPERTISIRTK